MLLTLILATSLARAPQAALLAGSWHGTSTCVDTVAFPACHDEQVIYDAHPRHAARDTVTLRADKVVNGVREFMGEFDFVRQADGSWMTEFRTPRAHGRWVLVVQGDALSGTLTDVTTGKLVRRAALRRG